MANIDASLQTLRAAVQTRIGLENRFIQGVRDKINVILASLRQQIGQNQGANGISGDQLRVALDEIERLTRLLGQAPFSNDDAVDDLVATLPGEDEYRRGRGPRPPAAVAPAGAAARAAAPAAAAPAAAVAPAGAAEFDDNPFVGGGSRKRKRRKSKKYRR